jgi:hypothetical protein
VWEGHHSTTPRSGASAEMAASSAPRSRVLDYSVLGNHAARTAHGMPLLEALLTRWAVAAVAALLLATMASRRSVSRFLSARPIRQDHAGLMHLF